LGDKARCNRKSTIENRKLIADIIFILFLFALGACVGSFLNVVIWRLPRGESLVSPPSHCPKCGTPLHWYDNLPIIGWLKLRGKCRHCGQPISPRYPLVEAVTGGLFAFYYIMFFMLQTGPCPPVERQLFAEEQFMFLFIGPMSIWQDWPIYFLYMFLVAGLLACSLIDAELFIIPVEIPWLMAAMGILVHAIVDAPQTAGALNLGPPAAALAAGGGLGLAVSIAMWLFGWIPTSFPQGEPMLEVDRAAMLTEIEQAKREGRTIEHEGQLPPPYTPAEFRGEMRKEMLFLFPPMLLGLGWLLLTAYVAPVREMWLILTEYYWFTGMLGAVMGALMGGFIVWITRILGTLAFGRVAMGLGDVHLMFGVGAIIGPGAAVVAFFLAPFFGLLVAVYMLLTGTRRELPYGPYLSLATAFVLLFYCPIFDYLRPGLEGLVLLLTGRA
jgi:leader peptidase (prepilin peptidase) / N-methyltransferase